MALSVQDRNDHLVTLQRRLLALCALDVASGHHRNVDTHLQLYALRDACRLIGAPLVDQLVESVVE